VFVGESLVVAVSVSSAPFWFWWLVPVVATVVVVVVVGLARRERRPRNGSDTIDDYTRFREAMAQVRRQGQDRP
jgi:membrane protein implicated in regulation of membrane protease activity